MLVVDCALSGHLGQAEDQYLFKVRPCSTVVKRLMARCPAGQRAIKRFTTVEHGLTLNKYWSSACPKCPLKAQSTTSIYRRSARWEHEAVLEAMQERLERQPDAMQLRRQTVGHPLGAFKAWMG